MFFKYKFFFQIFLIQISIIGLYKVLKKKINSKPKSSYIELINGEIEDPYYEKLRSLVLITFLSKLKETTCDYK